MDSQSFYGAHFSRSRGYVIGLLPFSLITSFTASLASLLPIYGLELIGPGSRRLRVACCSWVCSRGA